MSSSRSIAAARNRRAGDPVQQPQQNKQQQQNRPATSIASSAAFSQQRPTKQQYPPPPPSVSDASVSKLPFSKISVSDAIGLITLRLGKIEQYMFELQHEQQMREGSPNLPQNTQLIDNSVLTNMIHRLDSLEKKELSGQSKIEEEIAKLRNELTSKVDSFAEETNQKLGDIESAFVVLEENIQPVDIQPSAIQPVAEQPTDESIVVTEE